MAQETMIREMLRTSRWFYVKEPALPDVPRRRNSWYRKRALYTEIIRVVKESPGISTEEVARKLARPYEYVSPLLFHLKSFGCLRHEAIEVERTNGLTTFAGVPCVKQMLSKLSSEKTKGPWLRRLFRYEEWLKGKGYFGGIAELLDDCKKADTEAKYRHVDLMQEYLNSFRGSVYYKDSIATIIRGFYKKNRAELPREKVTFDRGMLIMAPSSTEEYIRPTEVWRIVSDGRIPVREKAMIAIVLCLGLDESTFVHQFNYYAYPQIVKALGRDQNDWDTKRAPVQVSLVRPKTQGRFYNFLPAKALVLLAIVGVSGTDLLAGGTFAGLVLGLAGQAVLSNVIAGLMVILARPFQVDDRVTVFSWQWGAIAPIYPPKFHSNDIIMPGYSGMVTDIGLTYTTVKLDDGPVIKFPNSILIQAAVVSHNVKERWVRTRYEVPTSMDIAKVLDEVASVVKKNEWVVGPDSLRVTLNAATASVHVIVVDALCRGGYEDPPEELHPSRPGEDGRGPEVRAARRTVD